MHNQLKKSDKKLDFMTTIYIHEKVADRENLILKNMQ